MHRVLGRNERVLPVLGAWEDYDAVHIITMTCEQRDILQYLLAERKISHTLLAQLIADVLSALVFCQSPGKSPLAASECAALHAC